MKTILFYVYALGKGGAERVLLTIAENLTMQYKVIILTDTIVKDEYDCSKQITRVSIDNAIKGNRAVKKIKRLVFIRKIAKQYDVSTCVAFTGKAGMRMLLALRSLKIRKVVAIRTLPNKEFPTRKKIKAASKLFATADCVTFQTEEQIGCFPNVEKLRTAIIENPLRKEICQGTPMRAKEKKIVAVGRLTENKNQEMLIKAFKLVEHDFPEHTVQIYGEGEKKEYLQELIESNHLTEKIFLRGNVSDITRYIGNAELFVHTSYYEGVPNALLEAMALGVPVVATECEGGGIQKYLTNMKNGILVPINDVKALADAIHLILENSELAESLSIEERKIKEELDFEKICHKWEKVIIGN